MQPPRTVRKTASARMQHQPSMSSGSGTPYVTMGAPLGRLALAGIPLGAQTPAPGRSRKPLGSASPGTGVRSILDSTGVGSVSEPPRGAMARVQRRRPAPPDSESSERTADPANGGGPGSTRNGSMSGSGKRPRVDEVLAVTLQGDLSADASGLEEDPASSRGGRTGTVNTSRTERSIRSMQDDTERDPDASGAERSGVA